ncbi:MAG: FAD-dependent oxidoreductase [Actinobacteria bacterium]|nr:FAD-dependent oxidoreductase [Actinomycetota bacterium]
MTDNPKYSKLLESGKIGSVTTRNRIIKTGAGVMMWHESDTVMRPEVLAFYEAMARGGTGLIIVESPTVDYPAGCRWRDRYRLDDDKFIPGMAQIAEVIHKHGCPTFMQMNHDGTWQAHLSFSPDPPYKGLPYAASDVVVHCETDFHNERPHPLTVAEIEDIVDKFGNCALRAKKAGFDGVDINASSSHLLHNFLSPFWNRRIDEYGGTAENRSRFVCQVVTEIKRLCGEDFPVTVCINGLEAGQLCGIDDNNCITNETAKEHARLIEKAGADGIMVRSHWIGYHEAAYLCDALFYPDAPIPLEDFPEVYYTAQKGAGANMLIAAGVKSAVSVPVIVVGRLDCDLGEQILEQGMADFIGMTRRLHADPEYANKVKEGRLDDIAPCTGCDNCLGTKRCRINALMGYPFNTIDKADAKKNVLVIGGGPGGMEAARVSALRGHDVTLMEKQKILGGLLPIAAMVKGPHPEDVMLMVDYLSRQLRKLGVKIRLGKEADVAVVEEMKPDVVFVATGAQQTIPEIKGIDHRNVVAGGDLHQMLKFYARYLTPYTLRSLSKLYMPKIGRNVVVIGGALQGCELAEFLAKRGRKVTIVDRAEEFGEGMVPALWGYLKIWFNKNDVKMLTGVREYVGIDDRGLTIVGQDGIKVTLQADTFVSALPLTPQPDLAATLQGKVPEIYTVGDCVQPGLIRDAINAGLQTAVTV